MTERGFANGDRGFSGLVLSGLTFAVLTFGCQMNKHDSERVAGMFESLGALQVPDVEEADIVVYLTCCVRESAETRLYGQVSSIKNIPLRESSPLGKRIIAIGGCIGQNSAGALLDELPFVDVVFGTFNLGSLPMLVQSALESGASQVEVLDAASDFPTSLPSHREHHWSAWLPISIGCDNFCTYCIVPHVRGREKSRPFDEVVAEAHMLVEQGVQEITLLGQNVNSYGRDLYGAPRFADLLHRVSETGVARIRFATSHPKDITDEVIDAFRTLPNVMPAIHLPVQSGSNRILECMNRRYTKEHYLERIAKLRAARPDIALSTDIIVGFPGETEQDFQDTFDLVDQVGYSQVFTFIFSPREGTPAANYPDDTPHEVVQRRFERLVDLVQERAHQANQSDVGSVVDVLVEGPSKRDPSILSGRSPKNQTVHARMPEGATIEELRGRIVPVRIDQARTWYLRGELVD